MKQKLTKLDLDQVLNYFPVSILWTIWLISSIVLLCTHTIPLLVALLPLLIPLSVGLSILLIMELANLITLITKRKSEKLNEKGTS